jgi:hypothetical protein
MGKGKWLAALRTSERNQKDAAGANRQNPQNLPEAGSGGFGSSRSSDLTEIRGDDGAGFGGFGGSASRHFHDRREWDEEDWRAVFEERAAILEFDEGLSRCEAAHLARQQIDEQRRMALQ